MGSWQSWVLSRHHAQRLGRSLIWFNLVISYLWQPPASCELEAASACEVSLTSALLWFFCSSSVTLWTWEMAVMGITCQGAPDPAIKHKKELTATKGLNETMSEKQSSVCKVEESKKVIFHSQWKILNDVITKGTAKEETGGGCASISIIAQAECK